MGSLVFAIILYVIEAIALWKIFQKAGEAGWKGIIPFCNSYVLCKISWKKSVFWITLILSVAASVILNCVVLRHAADPAAAGQDVEAMMALFTTSDIIFMLLSFVLVIVAAIIGIIMDYKLSVAFGHGAGFAVGLIFLPIIFMLILAFGSSQYVREKAQ